MREVRSARKCRHCCAPLTLKFVDLVSAPLSNAYLTWQALQAPERWYPLRVLVCIECWLVQTDDHTYAADIFTNEYAYLSSYSRTWLEHAERYVVRMVELLDLGARSFVVELGSNDGYLLQYVIGRSIPCLGIEPTASTAASARSKGVEVVERFFGVEVARELVSQGRQADLVVANNVLAHVPEINDFVSGTALLLKDSGVATFEFPHLLNLVTYNQFDTIYHEHYSYLSLVAVKRIFEKGGLEVFDIEEIPTHGGSLRVYAQKKPGRRMIHESVRALENREQSAGLATTAYYAGFQSCCDKAKDEFLMLLLQAKSQGKTVIGYGAAAKGNTLLNYAGVRTDLVRYVVDKNPSKQGKFLPGSRIPILNVDRICADRPDYILILPWNIRDEVMAEQVRQRMGRPLHHRCPAAVRKLTARWIHQAGPHAPSYGERNWRTFGPGARTPTPKLGSRDSWHHSATEGDRLPRSPRPAVTSL